jgi:hypothetical protein
MNTDKECELLPCPFCGGKTYNAMGYEYGKVSCDNSRCKISGVYFYPHQWNTRAALIQTAGYDTPGVE